jgi:PIN domain
VNAGTNRRRPYSGSSPSLSRLNFTVARDHADWPAAWEFIISTVTAAPIVETILLDTQVFVATGFDFNGKSFLALKSHLASGRPSLVMTNITIHEVKSRIRQSVTEKLVKQRTFVNGAKALFNSSIADLQAALNKFDPDVVTKDLCDQFDGFLQETKATIIDADDLTAGEVLEKYFAGAPPFGSAENKKHEFPDAFAIQARAEWAESMNLPMFVVSSDKLFQGASDTCSHLVLKGSINEVLDHVASDDEQLAAFIRAETMKRIAEIVAKAKVEFEDRSYWVEDENGDAQVEVIDLTPADEPEVIEIGKEDATLQLSIDADYKADLSYDDSATASYDDGTLIYVEHRDEEVEREQELTVQIELSFEQMDPASFEIVYISLIEPSKGFGIETQNNHDWPYK